MHHFRQSATNKFASAEALTSIIIDLHKKVCNKTAITSDRLVLQDSALPSSEARTPKVYLYKSENASAAFVHRAPRCSSHRQNETKQNRVERPENGF
ncbi:hypothetical protein L596_005296 [Steinernema carpocapsae]|uniref:Uncharacterized protein n=1 Tax=Steinernema carpocapsae TaxID=34508 RepID=A0A4U8UYJ3_STECR|nr:hypothetical protein L596_005296 [Steinernema carpocapsae]